MQVIFKKKFDIILLLIIKNDGGIQYLNAFILFIELKTASFFFGHAQEPKPGLGQTLFVTREISPCIWGTKSGKLFPLYGFAPDPFPTFGENFS